ncbi:MAG: cytochrome c biogenesis protein CcsA [Bacteroides sp.]|nr:cytochrome c biogenesis protein CcsA [Bacteroides sp.]MCM1086091.1 cytochrome c biogenesis protein CcsA [Bacteroides sp.]
MKALKYTSFGILAVLTALMVAATVLEKVYGNFFVGRYIYGSWWFVALWAVAAVCSSLYMVRRRLYRKPVTFALHTSFILILLGASVTWISGKQGHLHLRLDGAEAAYFENREGHAEYFPFSVRLDDFRVEHYPGTVSPMDYVSTVSIRTQKDSLSGEISMNHILRFKGYRFYQASYDADQKGSTLAVSHDPWGIGLTYGGYLLLLLSMIGFFLDRQSGFRQLLKHPALKKALCLAALLPVFSCGFAAQSAPRSVPKEVADEMGKLHVYFNGRICPLSTLSHDFCLKITKKDHYRDADANQFLAGWLFFYDHWKNEPVIHIKSKQDRKTLGLTGKKARLTDLDTAPLSPRSEESFALIDMVSNLGMLRVFPYFDSALMAVRWASPVDRLPAYVGQDTAMFIRLSLNYLNELLQKQDYEQAVSLIRKIGLWQQKQAQEVLPSRARFAAEQFYNRANKPLPAAVCLLIIGMAAFVPYCRRMASNRAQNRNLVKALLGLLCLALLYLSAMVALRAWVCGHSPVSNGYETMQAIAWFALLATLIFYRRLDFLLPLGFLVSGLAMLVSMMGSSNPQITPLMPVLSSPLLSVHVMLVMVSYTLFAFMMLNGLAGLWLHLNHKEASLRLSVVSRLMLYPAVFTLAAGIFVGAVWANVSWGRYWGWDPKEVWALITMLVYSFALHNKSFPTLNHPAAFHIFSIAAFLCVLITYFGVNFLLGGMHGYV